MTIVNEHLNYAPEFDLVYTDQDLNDIKTALSQEEENSLKEILELQKQSNEKKNLMKDLLDAAKKGALQYLDSMTDTGETFNRLKDSNKVRNLNDTEIIKKTPSVVPNESREPRTMNDARYNPFDKNVSGSIIGMSDNGVHTFTRQLEAYKQRTKRITAVSKEGKTINYKSNEKANFESLSGLRSYRIGSIVPMYPIDEIQEMYKQKKAKTPEFDNVSSWLMQKNYGRFEEALMKEYGFKTRNEVAKWISNNHLTIHEGADGMYLVPTDVHDAASHSGYRSKMTDLLKGKITREDLNSYITKEKIAYVKHEMNIRGTRIAKGIGMSAIKDILKCSIVVICSESYNEFKVSSKEKIIDRIIRIFKKSWEHIKKKCASIISDLWKNIKGSLLSEFLTMLNDFFFKTFKNIFRIIRQMWSSIKSAFKIIFSTEKSIPSGERIYEASKILSAGVVGLIGFSLNELIDKGLTSIGVPFASFISECLSGLFAGVMSAVVMMIFDRYKDKFFAQSPIVRELQQQSKLILINSANISLSSLQIDRKMQYTYNFVGQTMAEIGEIRKNIKDNGSISKKQKENIIEESKRQSLQIESFRQLKNKYLNDKDF